MSKRSVDAADCCEPRRIDAHPIAFLHQATPIKGVEVALTWKPLASLNLYASYSHLFGDRQKGSSATRNIPSQEDPNQTIESTLESFYNVAPDKVFTCGIDYRFLRRFRINLEMYYVDRRKLASTSLENTGGRRHLTSNLLFDVNLFVSDFPVKNSEIALKIKNITDKEYDTRGVFGLVDGEGSSMYLMMKYTF